MDTNRIRYFLSLARTGSVTQAAEFHRISPAAFSKAMRVLGEEFSVQLTVPCGRGIVLTDRARELVPVFTEIVSKLDGLRGKGTGEPPAKVLRIATFEVFSTYFLEWALSTSFLGHDCLLYEATPGRMEEAVAAGTADLALSYLPIPHPELDFVKIAPVTMGIFSTRGARGIGGADPIDYRKLPFVVPITPVEGSPTKVRGLDGWPDDAFPRKIRFRVQMLETALGLCRRGLACAYIPRFVARLHNELVRPRFALHELKAPPSLPKRRDHVYLIKRKSDVEGGEARLLASAIRKICPDV